MLLLRDVSQATPELIRTVAIVLQKFLTDKPGALVVIIAACDRREVIRSRMLTYADVC